MIYISSFEGREDTLVFIDPELCDNGNSDILLSLKHFISGKLLQKTYQGLDPLIKLSGSQHLLSQQGCMYVYKTEREFENARAGNQARKDQGVEFTELDASAIRELEPAIKLPFVKGLLFDKASHVVNPQSLTTSYFECFLFGLL